jgi:hypothetical protein
MTLMIKALVAAAALAAASGVAGVGVAHAYDDIECHVSLGGALWCENTDTGESWQASSYGEYEYCDQPYANRHLCP